MVGKVSSTMISFTKALSLTPSFVLQNTVAAEKFYGALLEKIDTILSPMGASDVGCRERAVCAMYKDPFKHSPYSNLVSNELSK